MGGSKMGQRSSRSNGRRSQNDDLDNVAVSETEVSSNSVFVKFCVILNHFNRLAGLLAMGCSLVLASASLGSMVQLALNLYSACFCLALTLTEFELKSFFRVAPFLEGWVLRGVFFIFVGLLLRSAILLLKAGNLFSFIELATGIISSYLMCTGSLYIVMGFLCFRQLKTWQIRKVKRKKVMKAEMVKLSKQKDEIEKLLVDTEKKMELL